MTKTGFVYDITCPHCGKDFSVSADEYQSITEQIKKQIGNHIRQEAKAEQEEAINQAVQLALANAQVTQSDMEKKAAREKAETEQVIHNLQHQLEMAQQEKKNALLKALADADAEKNQAEAASRDEIAKRDQLIATLQQKASAAETEKKLAVKTATEELTIDLQGKDAEIAKLKGQIETQEQTAELQKTMLKDQYEATLRLKDEEIKQIKEFKSKLSTKALGESLEKYCENQFNSIRTAAFPGAYFDKDNNAKSGSKGDYIFRETVDGAEILSIMFEMKTEADETSTKHKNEDFLKELDKDRKEKGCEYAVLVSTLEADSEFYNAGIQDVSFRYPKMYVVRPQQFITIISLLRNAALNSAEYQKELAAIKSQQLDLAHFEENMEAFKAAFGRNYQLASTKLLDAVNGIDKTISVLQKTKENLLASENQLRLANNKAEDLSIKKLTKGAPSVAKLLAEANEAQNGSEPIAGN